MTVTHVTATISPRPGKESRVQELIETVVQGTHENEPNCSTYFMTKVVDSTDFIIIETYKSKADFDFHKSQHYFQDLGKIIEAEDLVSKPLSIIASEKISGFEAR